MSGNGRTIYIAGAGIAGMTLALALAKFGAHVVVMERNAQVQEVGAGLQISPNARHILNRLGLDRAIASRAFEPSGIELYPYGAARPLVTLELGPAMIEAFGAPYVVMHRADLADLLFRACKRFANIDILFGVKSHIVVSHPRGVTVTIDEADGKTRTGRAFAFIGADGVNSHTRTHVLMGPKSVYSGMVAWRATLPIAALDGIVAPDRTSLFWGPGYHAVCYPLPYRQQMNVALFTRAKRDIVFSDHPPSAPVLPWSMTPSPHFRAILAAAGQNWTFWPCSTVESDDWYSGGIGLIGDAAHAMLPFQAQGAVMAIEDAAILAPLLMTTNSAQDALQAYASHRKERVARVRKTSADNGNAFHMSRPLSLARDAVVRSQGPRGHLERLAWLYGYDAAPDPVPGTPRRPARSAIN